MVGIELNILEDGFDFFDIPVEKLDYAIASMHTFTYSPKTHTREDNTNAFLKAMECPYVKILGHIDNPAYPIDYEKVILEAHKRHILIELNNASLHPDSARPGAKEKDRIILDICRKNNIPIILSSDAHIKYQINCFDLAEQLLEEISFPDELVVNYNMNLIEEYIIPLMK
ncbi:MAG: hypothetical protein Q4D13_01425 [Erysipelotrichaceae bacterium]|nr:hypothetical protein [Erysipelotrichaceae bacterium]